MHFPAMQDRLNVVKRRYMQKVEFPKQRPMAIGFMHKDKVLSQVELEEELPEDVSEGETEVESPKETESVNDF